MNVKMNLKKKVLLTAVGGDIGYGVVKALRKGSRDLYLVGCDIKKYNTSCDVVDQFLVAPPYREEETWLRFMSDLIKREQIDYFWPVAEPEIRLVDKNRAMFDSVSLVINQSHVLDTALDKYRTARFLSSAGIPAPRTWLPEEPCSETFPLIVKEAFSCGSHAVRTANSKDELAAAVREMDTPIIQEYVGDKNNEYTLTIFSDGKVTNHIAFRRTLGLGSMSQYVELVHDERLGDTASRIASLFALRGSINVQMRKHNDRYYIFEINPRISSTIGFRLLLGFNDADWWLDLIDGKPVSQYACPPQKVHGVRHVEEKLFYE